MQRRVAYYGEFAFGGSGLLRAVESARPQDVRGGPSLKFRLPNRY
jgi:hypothetical protein